MGTVVGNSFYFDFEVRFMEWLQRVLGDVGVAIVSPLSLFGEEMVLIAIMGFIYWCYDKKMGEFVGTSIVLSTITNPLIKNIFWRRRPYFDHETIKCLRPVEKDADIYDIAAQGFSFPSGHSTNSVACYSAIAARKKAVIFKVIAVVMPIAVGLSRMAVGVHYPTDVLVGWLCGGLCVIITMVLWKKVSEEKRWLMYLVIFLICCLGLLYCKTSDYFASLGLVGGIFAAFEFEKRVVNFKETRSPIACVLRVLLGGALYILLNNLFKMPFSSEFLSSGTFISGVVRTIRYLIVSFITVGIYPFSFKFIKGRNE